MQLKALNKDATELHPTLLIGQWTAFLKELAPVNCLDDLEEGHDEDTDKRREIRRQYLDDLYRIAEMEEHYLIGDRGQSQLSHFRCLMKLTLYADSTDQFHYRDHDDEGSGAKRRTKRLASVVASDADSERLTSVSSTTGEKHKRPKRERIDEDFKASPIDHQLTDSFEICALTDDDAVFVPDEEPAMKPQRREVLAARRPLVRSTDMVTSPCETAEPPPRPLFSETNPARKTKPTKVNRKRSRIDSPEITTMSVTNPDTTCHAESVTRLGNSSVDLEMPPWLQDSAPPIYHARGGPGALHVTNANRPLPKEKQPCWGLPHTSDVSTNTSFDSSSFSNMDASGPWRPEAVQSTFPGTHDFSFAQQHGTNFPIQTYQTSDIPQPPFHPVPEMAFSPSSVMYARPEQQPNGQYEVFNGPLEIPPHQEASMYRSNQPIISAPAQYAAGTFQAAQYPGNAGLAPAQPDPQDLGGLPFMFSSQLHEHPQTYYPETTEYPRYHTSADFEAPAWNMRGFTGHSSGVGGGQPT